MDSYRPNHSGDHPCLNCAGFHYGRCFSGPRQCWFCGDWGHIQRYCLRKPHQRREAQETLPGTRIWCEMHGLNENWDLKRKVLDTLKTSAGAAIFVDDVCILEGKEVYFCREQNRDRFERPLVDRMTRRRSRSPSRERVFRKRERSRTPLANYRRSMSPESVRSTHAYHPRLPIPYSSESNAVVFEEARLRPQRANPTPPVQQIFHNEANSQQIFGCPSARRPQQPSIENLRIQREVAPVFRPVSRSILGELSNVRVQAQAQSAPQQRREEWVEDPHFVLGIGYGAGEADIAEAFEQRIWEIDQDRMGPQRPGEDKWSSSDKWHSSVRILEVARKQLLGY